MDKMTLKNSSAKQTRKFFGHLCEKGISSKFREGFLLMNKCFLQF